MVGVRNFGVVDRSGGGVVLGVKPAEGRGGAGELGTIGWPWYTALGTAVNLVIGSVLALRHRDATKEGAE